MSIQKFLALVSGKRKEVALIDSSSGASDAGKGVALDSTGKVAANMMPSGIGTTTQAAVASGALAEYSIINNYMNSEVLTMRLADAGTNKYVARGFVPAAVESAATGNFQTEGTITVTGPLDLTKDIYLSETPGGWTQTPVSGTGKINQKIGWPVSTTAWFFQPEEETELA